MEDTCRNYIGIQDESVIIVCSNCVQYHILLSDRKKFIDSFLENECFNCKQKLHGFCIDVLHEGIIFAKEMCYDCVSQCL